MSTLILLLVLLDGAEWKSFSEWFSRAGTPGAPAEVVASYGKQLKAEGVAEAEIARRTQEVAQYMKEHPGEALVLHFNRIYKWADAPFTREPSAYLRRIAATRKPGKALDIAMGQGRNSIWLAKQGWDVTGYDISDEALRQAAAGAAAAGVSLKTSIAAHESYDLGREQWDLIVMCYAFTRLSDKDYMQKVRDALRPGGVLVVEGFNGGKPPERNMILNAFLEYRVVSFEDLPDLSEWGKVKAPLLRMALEKQ